MGYYDDSVRAFNKIFLHCDKNEHNLQLELIHPIQSALDLIVFDRMASFIQIYLNLLTFHIMKALQCPCGYLRRRHLK